MASLHEQGQIARRAEFPDSARHCVGQRISEEQFTPQRVLPSMDSFVRISPQRSPTAHERPEATGVAPAAPFTTLPAELIQFILRACDDVGAKNLPFVNASTLALARDMPELRWQQRLLDDAVVGLKEDRLLAVLEKYRCLLKCRKEPLLLPQSTSMPCLQAIAKLVAGSRQRPLLVLSFESPRIKELFPPELTLKTLTFCENMDESIRRRYRAGLCFTPTIQDFYMFESMKADRLVKDETKNCADG